MPFEHPPTGRGSLVDTLTETPRLDRASEADPVGAERFAGGSVSHDSAPRSIPAYLLVVLRHRWKVILLVGLAAAAAGYVAVGFLPPATDTYTTFALIRVEPAEALLGAVPGRVDASDLKTQAELVKTRFVLEAALKREPAADRPAVRDNPAAVLKRLAADLKVEIVGPQILRVSLTGTDADDMPVLVNAVKDAYLQEIGGSEQARRVRRKEFLETAYRDCESRLAEKRRELSEAEAAGPATTRDDRHAAERLGLLQKELFRIELDLHRSRLELAREAQAAPADEISPAAAADLAEKDPLLSQYAALLAHIDDRIARYERVATDAATHEPYRTLRRDRQSLVDAIDGRKRELVQQHAARAAAARQERVGRAADRVGRLEAEEKLVRGLVAGGRDELAPAAKGQPDLTLKRYEIERLEGLAKQITDEVERLRLETNTTARTASLQDAAEPVVKQASKQAARTGMAVVAPFLFVAVVVLLWELRAGRIYGPEDVRGVFATRVLGAVPRLPGRGGPSKAGDWPSPLTDAVDAVCAALGRERGMPRVVVVTSAAPQEGKSVLARQLATRLARAGKKTLLVDADLYRPTVHRAFEMPAGPGLGELLCGTVAAAAAVRPTPTDDLFVLTAGTAGPEAFRALARGAAGPILTDLRAAFDAVVIDTSPILATTQPLIVGRYADAVVLSTLCTASRTPLVAEAIRRLSEVGIPVTGLVVAGAAAASEYGYYFRPDSRTPPVVHAGC